MELAEYWADTNNIGEKVFATIGRWKIKKAIWVLIVTTPDKQDRISDFDKYHGNAMDTFIFNCKQEERNATIIFYRYLFEKFRKPAKNDLKTYIITTAYCNLSLTHSKGKADGIYYPSVQFGGQGVNFAINSSFIKKEKIELTHVLRNEFVISENENGKHNFSETNLIEATNIDFENNRIEWKK
jgi:hypothetical protein